MELESSLGERTRSALFYTNVPGNPSTESEQYPPLPRGSTTATTPPANSTSVNTARTVALIREGNLNSSKGKDKETPAEALSRHRGTFKMLNGSPKNIFEPGQSGPSAIATNEPLDIDSIQRKRLSHFIKERIRSREEDIAKYRKLKGAYKGLQDRFKEMEDVLGWYVEEYKELQDSARTLENAVEETLEAYKDYARNYGPGVDISSDGEFITICCPRQRSQPPQSPSPSSSSSLSPLPLPPLDSDDEVDIWLTGVVEHLPDFPRTPRPPLALAIPTQPIPPATQSPSTPTLQPPKTKPTSSPNPQPIALPQTPLSFPPSAQPTTSTSPTQAFSQIRPELPQTPARASTATSQTSSSRRRRGDVSALVGTPTQAPVPKRKKRKGGGGRMSGVFGEDR
jgi:hypothetical protein